MRVTNQGHLLFRQLATYFLLSTSYEVAAIPAPQVAVNTASSITDPPAVTQIATATDGQVITEVYTPTTIAINGLMPPITAATTITSVVTSSDGNTDTMAIAIAAGAGVVGAGALAAWLFKPVPNAPPAPTTPPSYPTSTVDDPTDTEDSNTNTDTSDPTTTSEPAASCPFTPVNPTSDFVSPNVEPTWTGPIPSLTTSTIAPACTSQGSNNQLYRGTDPGYINALAGVFCKSDLTRDEESALSQNDLLDGNTYKTSTALQGTTAKFDFKFSLNDNGCPQNCIDTFNGTVKSCQYDSHTLYGGASSEQGCGNYSFMIDAEPNTKAECTGSDAKSGPANKYMYRDAAMSAITNFCSSVDGKSVKQGDASTNINSGPFSVAYADQCEGSGTYKITKDYCNTYLAATVDNCDTDTTMFKHGGILTDTDNCGQFKFSPTGFDIDACYPANSQDGYITGDHVQVTHAMAADAIQQFCTRTGQQTTLDPNNIPSESGGTQNTCTTAGMAECGYFYNKDGSRVTKQGSIGDISIRARAVYFDPGTQYTCQARQKYDISGARCVAELSKVLDGCNTNTLDNKDLGSFLEDTENGCVRWDFWAVSTHN